MDFEGVNVEGSEANLAELKRLGAPNVPAVAVGGKIVHGWQPKDYAELLGVAYDGAEMLSPDELRRRLDRILELVQQALRQTPADQLGMKPPGRDRTLRNLAYHAFRVGSAYVDALEQGHFPMGWFKETAPEGMDSGEAVAAFGDEARHKLVAWFATARAEVYAETAHTFYGECTVHELLERTTWHAGQHMRQIYHMLQEARVLPGGLPDAAVLEGLPLPREMW